MSNTNLDIEKVASHGLLSEFSYITLENKYFSYIASKNIFDDTYSEKNIAEYLNATKIKIDKIHPNYDWDKILSFEEKTADDYRGIANHRKEAILDILENYEIKEFSSDSTTDLQIMLLQDKHNGDYHIVSRGTASNTDIIVDADMAAGYNPQYQPALDFTTNMMNKYEINIENLTFSGHSLGGTIANMLGVTTGAQSYAYNPLGTENLFTNSVYGIDPDIDMDYARENNFVISYQDDGLLNGDILSNFATDLNGNSHLATVIPVMGKNVGLEGHSIIVLNDAIKNLKDSEVGSIEQLDKYNQNIVDEYHGIGNDNHVTNPSYETSLDFDFNSTNDFKVDTTEPTIENKATNDNILNVSNNHFNLDFLLDDNFQISSDYGYREIDKNLDGIVDKSEKGGHKGIDIDVPEGTSIKTPTDAVVVFNGVDSKGIKKGYGNYVILAHKDNEGNVVYTQYGHLKNVPDIEAGDKLQTGEVFAQTGNTGTSTGAHLHYEERQPKTDIKFDDVKDWSSLKSNFFNSEAKNPSNDNFNFQQDYKNIIETQTLQTLLTNQEEISTEDYFGYDFSAGNYVTYPDIQTFQTAYGTAKEYTGTDGSKIYLIPDENKNMQMVAMDSR